MQKVTKLAAALLLTLSSSTVVVSTTAVAAEKCPIDARQSKAVGQSVAKKVQRSFKNYQEGNLDGAIETLLEANPRNTFDKAYVARMLGNFYAEKGQMTTSVKYLKEAVNADILGGPDHAATLRLYADLLLQEKKFKDAITYYKKWLKFTCKDDAIVYRRIGIGYTELKDWPNVLKTAEKGLSVATEPDKGLYQMKFQAYFSLKQYKNSVRVLETMIPLFETDKRLWVQLAQLYLLTEDYKNAARTYDLAYQLGFLEKPDNVIRFTQLLASQGSPYRASKIFEKHLKSGFIEKNKKNLSALAGFYHNAKELKEAASYYGQAAAIDNDGKLYLKQGRLLSQDQQYKASIPVLKKALNAGLKHPGEAQFELALSYLSLKQYKPAYTYAELAAKDSKTKRTATSYLSYIKEKARIHNVEL